MASKEVDMVCRMENFTKSFSLKIINYSLMQLLRVDEHPPLVATFDLAGCNWAVNFSTFSSECNITPRRNCVYSHIALQVSLLTEIKTLMYLEVEFRLLDPSGRYSVGDHTVSKSEGYLLKLKDAVGVTLCMRGSEITNYLKEDSFMLECALRLVKPVCVDARSKIVLVPPSNFSESALCRQFIQLWITGEGADVAFKVSGEKITAHKKVLAMRSPVFRAQLFGPMIDSKSDCIKIEDMNPDVFRRMLQFVYTDSLPLQEEFSVEMAQHLLAAADRYGLERLKLICEEKLSANIDVETAATTMVLAEQHNCEQLKEICLHFVASREKLQAVMESDGFSHLMESCPSVMKELLGKLDSERRS
ncbi:BTB/POZ/MATH-domain protein [Rhynchospora pubera]|uniref:BTB/POZ/MATH-domain protein n=1 Tax=Rhynchospora pubera TaxID=906938 RepID=A0AAV8C380_9POAL|nr:BTB/POZ/MATH-domain protein [Rhynchospora pubera]